MVGISYGDIDCRYITSKPELWHVFQTYTNGMPIEKIMMVKKIGKYLKVYVANGVAPEYKQKSYGKYKLSKLS